MLSKAYRFLRTTPVIPVMVINRVEDAVPMAQALVAGGLTVLEVTLRTSCALAALEAISKEVPGAKLGAGTVCSAADVQGAVAAGAEFLVSPGQSEQLFHACRDHNVPLLPGAVTATEVMAAAAAGFQVVKFFPAATSGGAAAIKALGGPFPEMNFVPTGGIGPHNYSDYARLPNVIAVGGSWMLPAEDVARGDWATVSRMAADSVAAAATHGWTGDTA